MTCCLPPVAEVGCADCLDAFRIFEFSVAVSGDVSVSDQPLQSSAGARVTVCQGG